VTIRESPIYLAGLGTASPPNTLSQAEFARFSAGLNASIPREEALIHALARQSGVDQRHTVLDTGGGTLPFYTGRERGNPPTTAERMEIFAREAPRLAIQAARRAIASASLDPAEIDHVVVATCTGFMSPGIDFAIARALGLPPTVGRTLLGFMGCHAAINATRAGRDAVRATGEKQSTALVVCVELCTLHFQHGMGRDVLVPNSLFADGAAAWVLTSRNYYNKKPRIIGIRSFFLGEETREKMSWSIGNHGFRMTLASDVPEVLARECPAAIIGFLESCDIKLGSGPDWAIHPGGPRIVQNLARELGLSAEKVSPTTDVLRSFGNMSSSTVPFVWDRLGIIEQPRPTVSLAFGPGLVAEMMLVG